MINDVPHKLIFRNRLINDVLSITCGTYPELEIVSSYGMYMKKYPKFMITEYEDNNFINPRFIAKIVKDDVSSIKVISESYNTLFLFKHFDVKTKYSLGCKVRINDNFYSLIVLIMYDNPESYLNYSGISYEGLLSRMGDWFFTYQKSFG
jgi:hypothetical protein